MAKEKNAGTVLLRGTVNQTVANTYVQIALLTGIATSGSDALVIKQVAIEYPTINPLGLGIVEAEVAMLRASKLAMPTVFDDDVLYKDKYATNAMSFVGALGQKGIALFVPTFEIVVIEDIIYVAFKTLNATGLLSANVSIVAQPASVTSDEKVGLLLTRIN